MFDEVLDTLTDRPSRRSGRSGGLFDRLSQFLSDDDIDERRDHRQSRERDQRYDDLDEHEREGSRYRPHDRERRDFDFDIGD